MQPISRLKIFLLTIAFATFGLFITYAIDTVSEGWRVDHGATKNVTGADAVCKKVTNAHASNDYFIPTASTTEWTAFQNNLPLGVSLNSCEYVVGKSLLFDRTQSQYLSRTPGMAGDRKKWTWSGWVKRSGITRAAHLLTTNNDSNAYSGLYFDPDGRLAYFEWAGPGTTYYFSYTNGLFRDPAYFSHVVISVDTAQATGSNRVKFYIDGIRQDTYTASAGYLPQNYDTKLNSAVPTYIWINGTGTDYYDGYLSDVHFVDGQALDASAFGQSDGTTGKWKPAAYAGSHGANGFHFAFDDELSPWKDSASIDGTHTAANHWTANNLWNLSAKTFIIDDGTKAWNVVYSARIVGNGTVNLTAFGGAGNISGSVFTGINAYNGLISDWQPSTVKKNGVTLFSVTGGAVSSVGQYGSQSRNADTVTQNGVAVSDGDIITLEVGANNSVTPYWGYPNNPPNLVITAAGGAFIAADAAITADSPTNNFATMNSVLPINLLYDGYYGISPTYGNLKITGSSSPSGNYSLGTMAITSQSTYFEGKVLAGASGTVQFGIWNPIAKKAYSYDNTGVKVLAGTSTAYGATFTTNDVIGVAANPANGTLQFFKNGVSQGVISFAFPPGEYLPFFYVSNGNSSKANFGQWPFAYTPPTGFNPLSTANLPTPAIPNPKLHFDVLAWTGNGSSVSVPTSLNSIGLFWWKNRSAWSDHVLVDSIRGFGNQTNQASGGSLATTYNLVISANTNNYNLYTAALGAGYDGTSLATVNLTINAGVTVGSASVASPALNVGNFPNGVVINLTNNGTISGAGGAGESIYYTGEHSGVYFTSASAQDGGTALSTPVTINVTNNGSIYGWGGGWAGITGYPHYFWQNGYSPAAGGGWAGSVPGAGGCWSGAGCGSAGTASAGGAGYASGIYGGAPGMDGWNGYYATWQWIPIPESPVSGGKAGYYIQSGGAVNWIVAGTRVGRVGSLPVPYLSSNTAWVERTSTSLLSSIGSGSIALGSSTLLNANGNNYVGWTWKAGNSTVANTVGTIPSQVSVNPLAGFSIVKFTGNGTAGATVGHGLWLKPSMIFVKTRTGAGGAADWVVYHSALGATENLRLQSTAASSIQTVMFNDTEPTTTTFTLGNNNNINTNTDQLIAYAFAEVPGYSKFGKYLGNGSSDGAFVYLGFKPKFVLTKRVDGGSEHWNMFDGGRIGYNPANYLLYSNLVNGDDATLGRIDLLSNGFKTRDGGSGYNANNATYVYAAFAGDVMQSITSPNTQPLAPTLIASMNGNFPTLSAHYNDADPGDTGRTNYRIATSAAGCLDNSATVSWGTSSPTATNSGATNWTATSSISGAGTYYWCAQNDDGELQSAWVGLWTVTNTPPNIPTFVFSTNSPTPTLSAQYSDPDNGDTGRTNYRIATSAAGCLDNSTTVSWGTSSPTATNSGATNWTATSSIGSPWTYYWCAQNDDGELQSAWTGIWTVVVPAGFVFNQTISADTTNYDLRTAAIAAGWNQTEPLIANVTINAGIRIYASSTNAYAFKVWAFPAGSAVTITNNGYIAGAGGAGGVSSAGSAGWPGLYVDYPTTIINNGTVSGGGGGGGGGAPYVSSSYACEPCLYNDGYNCVTYSTCYTYGYPAGGNGATTGLTPAGAGSGGGAGGNGWQNGVASTYASGSGGTAVTGNSNITWAPAGTILGGTISYSRHVFNATISTNTTGYNLRNAVIASGWNQTFFPVVEASVTIGTGVVVSGAPAFTIDLFPTGSVITLTNNGYISGNGGGGWAGGAGGGGNLGLSVAYPTTVINNGTVSGGGGGGGGGAPYVSGSYACAPCLADDGYGSCLSWSTCYSYGYPAGGNGATTGLTAAGAGSGGGAGGTGWQPGVTSTYAGGAGGTAVNGNPNVTWSVAGTRNGTLQ